MLPRPLAAVPQQEIGVSYLKTFPRHRCDLLGVGLSERSDPASYDWHNHDRPEAALIQYTLSGEGRLHCAARDHTWRVPAGQGMILPMPASTRYWLPPGHAWRFIFVMLGGDAALDHVGRIVDRHGLVFKLPAASSPIAQMTELYRTCLADPSPDERTANIAVHRLLLELETALASPAGDAPAAIDAARALVDLRYADPLLTVEDLASAAGYSKYHFSRLFRQYTGSSPYQYLLHRRLSEALRLLTRTDQPIKQIARAAGFSEESWFCSAFKQALRATPSEVRRQHRALGLRGEAR